MEEVVAGNPPGVVEVHLVEAAAEEEFIVCPFIHPPRKDVADGEKEEGYIGQDGTQQEGFAWMDGFFALDLLAENGR